LRRGEKCKQGDRYDRNFVEEGVRPGEKHVESAVDRFWTERKPGMTVFRGKRGLGVALTLTVFGLSCAAPRHSTVTSSDKLALQRAIFAARSQALPAVVHIQPISEVYTSGKKEKQTGVGSGVIVSPDGHIITNYHVAGKAKSLLCTLSNREKVTADLIGGDPLTDIAVCQLDLEQFKGEITYAEFGDSDHLEVGEYVMALGSPLALDRTVSLGVVSCVDRYMSDRMRLPSGERTGEFNTWIQTDAAINPGNSGGPLVNLQGEIVGINARTALFADNLGFAIPINTVREVYDQILAKGKVERSWIGVEIQPLQELEQYFGTEERKGALISHVDVDSPAAAAGLREGDVILTFDGKPLTARFKEEVPHIHKLIADTELGKEVRIRVLRDGQEQELSLITQPLGELLGEDFDAEAWGFTVKGITRQMVIEEQLEDERGVMVTGVSPSAAVDQAQLLRGDVIRSIGDDAVENLESFQAIYESLVAEEREKVLLRVKRSGGIHYILLQPHSKEEEEEGS
jgi:serine protease Do